ncbi:DUF2800 domain-containing protein [Stutzerimonas nitrititolerans]|uniref:DUF2800 domain-containing protein n=1 Tax=Stutzerimonas nitrititolerans TaxID=2482751 RepID=UPI00289DC556|nr:DUF2800 domain-containing protein [Stutzerimonas nitrititolerans]
MTAHQPIDRTPIAAAIAAHHRLSPSDAEGWMVCPGKPRMEERFPEESSEFSSEGTAAHTVRERCLNEGIDVDALVGEKIEADGLFFEVTDEWVRWLQPGIDRIREAKAEWVFEHRVEMDPWIEGGFGTLDAGGISDDLITIDDLKFGRGVTVDAERNKQMMIYALGFWMNYARHRTKATRFLLRIDQPRVSGGGSEWYTTLDELLVFAEEVAAAAIATLDPDAPLKPSPKGCRFCRAARNSACYALDQFVLDLLGIDLESLDADRRRKPELTAHASLTPERRSYVLEHKSLITSWVNNLHAAALDDALKGLPVPGFKAVATLGDRSWVNEAEAEEFWKAKMPAKAIYTQRLKSPAQMESAAGTRNWKAAQELIHRPEGKPALVPESDKREALIPILSLLDDLDDDDDLIAADEIQPEVDEFDDLI